MPRCRKQQKNPPIGPQGLARIIAALHRRVPDLPVVGIAGIDAGNAAEVIGAGADGVAVISALSQSPDPTSRGAQACATSSTPCWRSEAHDGRSRRR